MDAANQRIVCHGNFIMVLSLLVLMSCTIAMCRLASIQITYFLERIRIMLRMLFQRNGHHNS